MSQRMKSPSPRLFAFVVILAIAIGGITFAFTAMRGQLSGILPPSGSDITDPPAYEPEPPGGQTDPPLPPPGDPLPPAQESRFVDLDGTYWGNWYQATYPAGDRLPTSDVSVSDIVSIQCNTYNYVQGYRITLSLPELADALGLAFSSDLYNADGSPKIFRGSNAFMSPNNYPVSWMTCDDVTYVFSPTNQPGQWFLANNGQGVDITYGDPVIYERAILLLCS